MNNFSEKPKIYTVQRTDTSSEGLRGASVMGLCNSVSLVVWITDLHGILGEVEEHTFRRDPEVGFTPDMIDDDLPTNPDYLDEAFGADAGAMEFSDDEFLGESTDEGEMSESMLDSHADIQSEIRKSTRLVESVSQATDFGDNTHGETIKMLVPDIQIIEDYFETIEPDPLLSTDTKLVFLIFFFSLKH